MAQVFVATGESARQAAAAACPAPIDFVHLRRYTLNDAALEKEILDLFAAHLPLTIGELRSAVDPLAWNRAAHTLKGSARAVGAGALADLAASAEQTAGLSDPAVRRAVLGRIEATAAALLAFIAAL